MCTLSPFYTLQVIYIYIYFFFVCVYIPLLFGSAQSTYGKKSWDELIFDTVCVMIMTLLFPVAYVQGLLVHDLASSQYKCRTVPIF